MSQKYKPQRPHYKMPANVHQVALERIRWVFEEFDNQVTVSMSGGKDSTVIAELALQVARERDALPLRAIWLDQECELQATADYMSAFLRRPEIEPHWYQVPFRLFNATNHETPWLDVWDPDPAVTWVRDKDPIAYHENDLGADRFVNLLTKIGDRHGGAMLTGVRAEEATVRRAGLTGQVTHKWVTWGNKSGKNHIRFHPIYDWSYRDVWKAICDGDDPDHPGEQSWQYNRIYDLQHQHGVPPHKMRVSNYHHETAIHALFWLQEAEPETWARAVQRLHGINTAGHLGEQDFYVTELPFMFRSWQEYRSYLVQNLILKPEDRARFENQYERVCARLPWMDRNKISRQAVAALLANDLYFTKGEQFIHTHNSNVMREKWRKQWRRKPKTPAA